MCFVPDAVIVKVSKDHDRYWCPRCRQRFSLLSYTWLHDLKLPLQKWWMVLWCWTSRICVKQAVELSELSEMAIRHWYDQFRKHLPENPHILSRIVQLDEAYGKGWSLIMAKQKHSRKVAYVVLPEKSVERHQAIQFLINYVKPRSRLYTDGAAIYRGIEK